MASRFAPSAYGHSVGDAKPYDPPRYQRIAVGKLTVLRQEMQPAQCSRCGEAADSAAMGLACRGYHGNAVPTKATHAAVQREITLDRLAEQETLLLKADGTAAFVESGAITNRPPKLPAPPKVGEALKAEPISPQQRRKARAWVLRRMAPPQRKPQHVEWQPFRADATVEAALQAANAALHARGAR